MPGFERCKIPQTAYSARKISGILQKRKYNARRFVELLKMDKEWGRKKGKANLPFTYPIASATFRIVSASPIV